MSNTSTPDHELSEHGRVAVSTAGEMLKQAAQALAALSPADLKVISEKTEGKLPDCLLWALAGAGTVSPFLRESLIAHPPKGVVITSRGGVVDVQLPPVK